MFRFSFSMLLFSCVLGNVSSAWSAYNSVVTASAPFVVSEGEQIYRMTVPAGNVGNAQSLIADARQDHPDALLVIEPSGDLLVGDSSLRLGSFMVLLLSPDAGVKALPDCTAPSLVLIEDAESVAVVSAGPESAPINGGGHPITGIRVVNGKRMVMDRLHVSRCGVAGITYQGKDPEAVNEAGAVTRCRFEENGDGLQVRLTAGFICQDNMFTGHSGTALAIASKNSVVAGNDFADNKVSIQCGSDRSVITRNTLGDAVALELMPTSAGNLVSENRATVSGASLILSGSGQQLFRNVFDEAKVEVSGSGEMILVANEGMQVDAAPNLKIFNPPTFTRSHDDPVIVPGLGRIDLKITGGNPKKDVRPLDLKKVGEQLRQTRSEHPDDVIVLHLEGEFLTRAVDGLQLLPNTCLILNGRIRSDPGTEIEPQWKRGVPLTQVLLLPETGFCSLSGGTIDAGRQAFFPVNASTGAITLIEGVNLTAGAREGVYTKGRDPAAPLFIYRCNVYGNRLRGIWSHAASRVHAIANVCVGNHSDGIDIDAHAIDCTALFNVCSGNRRHGIFVEEAVQNSIVFGNVLYGNIWAGVHVWNEEVKGNTGGNVIAANECIGNRRGVSVGGRAGDRTAHGNFFFNNICRENRLNGIWSGNEHATGNYFCQSVVGDNLEKQILNLGDAYYLNVNDAQNMQIAPSESAAKVPAPDAEEH